ncbi:hypothetical protein [Malacoplasma muris]|uniref:hypothetical protein n=1 Tax=Malacoplasma muris TaxID=2119 RepID=UPI00398F7416
MSKFDNKQKNKEKDNELKELFSNVEHTCNCELRKSNSCDTESIDFSCDSSNDEIELQPLLLDNDINSIDNEIIDNSIDEKDETFVTNEFEVIEELSDDNNKINLEDLTDDINESFDFDFKNLNEIPDLNLDGFNEIELSVKFKKTNSKNNNKKCCSQQEKEECMSNSFLDDFNKENEINKENEESDNEKVFIEEIKTENNSEKDLNKLENMQLLDNLDIELFDETAVVDNQYLNDFVLDDSSLETNDTGSLDGEFFNGNFSLDNINTSYDIEINQPTFNEQSSVIVGDSLNNEECNNLYDIEINEQGFNEESYFENISSLKNESFDFSEQKDEIPSVENHEFVSMEGIILKSQEYKENLNNKKDIIVDSNEQVIFDDSDSVNFDVTKLQEDNEEKQVIFDETILNSDKEIPSLVNTFDSDKKDLFDFDFVQEKMSNTDEIKISLDELKDNNNSKDDSSIEEKEEELINIEVPSFETFDINNMDNQETNNQEDILELINFNNDDNDEESQSITFQSSFPSINVDDEVNSLMNIEDIEVTSPVKGDFDSTELRIDDITIEYVPEDDEEEFLLLDNELVKKEEEDINSETIVDNNIVDEECFTIDNELPEEITNNEVVIDDEYKYAPIIDTTDEVQPLDYSSYTVASYIQPEVFEEKVETVFEDYSNIDSIVEKELPSWSTKQDKLFEETPQWHQDEFDTSALNSDKEFIVKNELYPSVEEQIRKMKRPNLFRKYTVATAANMVILKSIDRLLTMTNSVIERQGTKRK